MKRFLLNWLGAALAISLGAQAYAEVSAMEKIGDQWQTMKENKTVQLVKDLTIVKLNGNLDRAKPNASGHADIDMTLTFKNFGGAQTVWFGLPDSVNPSATMDKPILMTLTVTVDGKKMPVERKMCVNSRYKAYYLSYVVMPAKATKVVKVNYKKPLASDAKGYGYRYMLDPGANWKGNIQLAQMTLDFSRLSGYESPYYYPENSVKKGKLMTWTNKNVDPQQRQNIYATYRARNNPPIVVPIVPATTVTKPGEVKGEGAIEPKSADPTTPTEIPKTLDPSAVPETPKAPEDPTLPVPNDPAAPKESQ